MKEAREERRIWVRAYPNAGWNTSYCSPLSPAGSPEAFAFHLPWKSWSLEFLFFLSFFSNSISSLHLNLIWPSLKGLIRLCGNFIWFHLSSPCRAQFDIAGEGGLCRASVGGWNGFLWKSWEIVVCSWWLSSPSQRHYSPLDDCVHFPFHHPMLCTWQEGGKKKWWKPKRSRQPKWFYWLLYSLRSQSGWPGPETACQAGIVFLTRGLAGWLVTRFSGPSRYAAPRGGLFSGRAEPPLSIDSSKGAGESLDKSVRAGVEDGGEIVKRRGKKEDSWHRGVQLKTKRKGSCHTINFNWM